MGTSRVAHKSAIFNFNGADASNGSSLSTLTGTPAITVRSAGSGGMDEAAIEEKGLQPFASEFERIAAINNKAELAAAIAHLQRIGASPLFLFSSTPDYTDADMQVVNDVSAA